MSNATIQKRPASRGPRCAHLDERGECAFAGGRCIDGSLNVAKSAKPFFCNFFKRKPARRGAFYYPEPCAVQNEQEAVNGER